MTAGTFVTEVLDYDGGRPVTVYVPGGRVEAVVFAGDGELISGWGPDLASGDVPSTTMVVGVHRHPDDTLRLHEYSAGFEPGRFARHERFFLEDVQRWIETRFSPAVPPARTAVFGVSAGAELAVAIGLRHPDRFIAIMAASLGAGYRPPDPMPRALPRAYLVAGDREPFFLANTARWATALGAAGAEVVFAQRAGSHGDPFWRAEFTRMVEWAFAHQG